MAKVSAAVDHKEQSKSQRKSTDRRAQITSAALRCLQRDGYASLTARKVAVEAGIALGHMTYHFTNMDEVLAETYTQASSILLAATDKNMSRSPATPIEQLGAFLGAGFAPEFLRRDYLRVRIDLWSAALAHDAIARTERELYQRYRRSLTELLVEIGNDRTPPARIAMVADTIMAILDGLWLDWVRREDQSAIDNGLEACIILARTLLIPAGDMP